MCSGDAPQVQSAQPAEPGQPHEERAAPARPELVFAARAKSERRRGSAPASNC